MFDEINEILCIHKMGPLICSIDSRNPLLKNDFKHWWYWYKIKIIHNSVKIWYYYNTTSRWNYV